MSTFLQESLIITAQKMKFPLKDFSRCEEIRSFLSIWSHLLKKNSIYCAMHDVILNPQRLISNQIL